MRVFLSATGSNCHFEAQLTPVNDPTMKVEWFLNGQPLTTGVYFATKFFERSHLHAALRVDCKAIFPISRIYCVFPLLTIMHFANLQGRASTALSALATSP